MIEASANRHSGLVARLATSARKLALAHAENRTRAARHDASRWRRPHLLWPLSSRDI